MAKEAVKKVAKKATPKRTTKKVTPKITHDDIATRAYYIALEGGGDPFENWIRAERELVES